MSQVVVGVGRDVRRRTEGQRFPPRAATRRRPTAADDRRQKIHVVGSTAGVRHSGDDVVGDGIAGSRPRPHQGRRSVTSQKSTPSARRVAARVEAGKIARQCRPRRLRGIPGRSGSHRDRWGSCGQRKPRRPWTDPPGCNAVGDGPTGADPRRSSMYTDPAIGNTCHVGMHGGARLLHGVTHRVRRISWSNSYSSWPP